MYQKTTYHFNKEDVKPHDIFFAEHYDFNGNKVGHYFYCIHAQNQDKNNELFRDITGLLITTRDAMGYTVPITISGKEARVCCDRPTRFISETGKVSYKFIQVSKKTKKGVLKIYKQYIKEITRQLKKGLYTR